MAIGQSILSSNKPKNNRVSADGSPDYKPGGITIDWDTVTALAADTTMPDGSVFLSGQKLLRYGQIVCRIGVAEVQTVTFTGGPTAGTITLTLPAAGDQPAQSTSALPYNESAANVQAALRALSRIGATGASVSRLGAGSAGDPYIYTVTFNRSLGDVSLLTQTNTFTGGTTPTGTIAVGTAAGSTAGYYGPYNPDATDGRQTLSRGECFIMDETVVQYPAGTSLLSQSNDHYGSAIQGGLLWRDKVLHSAALTHTLALGPTLAEVEAAFPAVQWTSLSL